MKALLALHESTTEEIIGDLLQIDPQYAKGIAGQMRLSQILELVTEIKRNNIDGALDILQPYVPNQPMEAGSPTPPQRQTTSIKPAPTTRPTVKGQNADADEEMQTGEPAGDVNISMTDKNGNELYSKNVKKSGAMRAARQLPKSAKGSAIRNIAGIQ